MSKVFVRFKVDADSWNGRVHFASIHETLEGAIAAVHPSMLSLDRETYGDRQVKNYVYEVIEEVEVQP